MQKEKGEEGGGKEEEEEEKKRHPRRLASSGFPRYDRFRLGDPSSPQLTSPQTDTF